MDMELLAQQVLKNIFIELEASGRHVHVTKEQALALFGHDLTPERPLSQPGQFLAKERVNVLGPKGKFENVAVLGPARKQAQVEISLTDGRTLGIQPPVRLSGDVANSPGLTLRGEKGQVVLRQGAIVAKRHIHMTPADAEGLGVTNGEVVKVLVKSERTTIFDDVVVRVSPSYALAMHIDTDECNAAGAFGTVYGEVIL